MPWVDVVLISVTEAKCVGGATPQGAGAERNFLHGVWNEVSVLIQGPYDRSLGGDRPQRPRAAFNPDGRRGGSTPLLRRRPVGKLPTDVEEGFTKPGVAFFDVGGCMSCEEPLFRMDLGFNSGGPELDCPCTQCGKGVSLANEEFFIRFKDGLVNLVDIGVHSSMSIDSAGDGHVDVLLDIRPGP